MRASICFFVASGHINRMLPVTGVLVVTAQAQAYGLLQAEKCFRNVDEASSCAGQAVIFMAVTFYCSYSMKLNPPSVMVEYSFL